MRYANVGQKSFYHDIKDKFVGDFDVGDHEALLFALDSFAVARAAHHIVLQGLANTKAKENIVG